MALRSEGFQLSVAPRAAQADFGPINFGDKMVASLQGGLEGIGQMLERKKAERAQAREEDILARGLRLAQAPRDEEGKVDLSISDEILGSLDPNTQALVIKVASDNYAKMKRLGIETAIAEQNLEAGALEIDAAKAAKAAEELSMSVTAEYNPKAKKIVYGGEIPAGTPENVRQLAFAKARERMVQAAVEENELAQMWATNPSTVYTTEQLTQLRESLPGGTKIKSKPSKDGEGFVVEEIEIGDGKEGRTRVYKVGQGGFLPDKLVEEVLGPDGEVLHVREIPMISLPEAKPPSTEDLLDEGTGAPPPDGTVKQPKRFYFQ